MKIAYLRVSTKEQCEERQRQNIRDAGIVIDQEFVDKKSGKDMDRPNWRICFQALREGDTLVVDSLCRLGRRMIDVISTCEEVVKKGVVIKALKEGISSDSPMWKVVVTVMSLAAEMERERILERTQEGRELAKKRNVKFGRKKKDFTKELKKIKDYQDKGNTVGEIAKMMNYSRPMIYKILSTAK